MLTVSVWLLTEQLSLSGRRAAHPAAAAAARYLPAAPPQRARQQLVLAPAAQGSCGAPPTALNNASGVPNVLLIGDSISMGFGFPAAAARWDRGACM